MRKRFGLPERTGKAWLFFLLRGMACALVMTTAGLARAEQTFHVGITSFRDKAVTLREWEPTMAYLASRIPGTRFVVVPLNRPEFEAAVEKKEVDFVITNPEHYILLETVYGVSRVATLVKQEGGKTVNQFGGVVFVRSDRNDLHRLEDLKGKRIASVDRTSFAAFLLQYDLLKQQGIDIDRECQVDFLGFPQDLSVKAVLERKADVGFVRSGVLEAMAREGKITLSDLRVLHASQARDFPFLLSTGLYPEWPFAVAPQVPTEITNQVAAALLTMPPDSPAARSARYYRWSTPVEYLSVQNLMRRHHIYPYDQREAITFQEVLRQYAATFLFAAILILVAMTVLYLRAYHLNRALMRSREELDHLAHHDALTGLPNRNMLDYDLEKALSQAQRTGQEFAVCVMDLDGFKPINDQWGHKVGDEVLRQVAQRIGSVLRGGDTVARWGGDEFVFLLNGVATSGQLNDIVQRVLAAVAQPLESCENTRISASIGVSLYPGDSRSIAGLLNRADQAMYQAKQAGGNRYRLYSDAPPG